jgi:hypothetical protein
MPVRKLIERQRRNKEAVMPKVDVDFGECVSAFVKENQGTCYPNYVFDYIKELVGGCHSYEEQANLLFDLLDTIPNKYKQAVWEDRGKHPEM